MGRILDGRFVRDALFTELKPRVEELTRKHRRPGLAVVLVGDDPASAIYVRGKVKACQDLGIYSEKHTPAATVTTSDLVKLVQSLNAKPEIDGILVQMPLPKQVDSRSVLLAVAPDKDADGFHPLNVGFLVENRPAPRPCTPLGIMELLRRYDLPVSGQRALVVGRSDIVGKPMALMLLHAHATVTVCHSKTVDLPAECRRADILVAAIGRAGLITADCIKPGATVIDVGMNRVSDRALAEQAVRGSPERMAEFEHKGSLLVGDVNALDIASVAGAYTPVPGGVGPLTVAMLMANTVAAAEARLSGAQVH